MNFLIGLLSGLIVGLHGPSCRVIMIPLTGPKTDGDPIFQARGRPA